MALDLKKKIGKGSGPMPTKTTMNLAYHESDFHWKTMIPILVLIVLAAGAFLKFGFLDQMAKKTQALNELSAAQSELSVINAKLADYNEIANQYGRYSYGWMTEDEAGLVNRTEILELIEDKIASEGVVENYAVANNTITVNVSGITLDEAREVVKQLKTSNLVSSATIYSAKTAEDSNLAEVYLQFTVANETEEETEAE